MIDEEDAIQVIDLMLKGDGQEAFGLAGHLFTFKVQEIDHDPLVPPDIGRVPGNGETAFLLV